MATDTARSEPASAIVLAGGRSTRMGRDKAFMPFRGRPVVETVIAVLEKVFEEIIVVTDRPGLYGHLRVRGVRDVFPRAGPLGGIHTGLVASTTHSNFVAACDMPFLHAGFIRHMLASSRDLDALVPRIGGYLEPTHAVYTKNCIIPIEKMIASRNLAVRSFFPLVRVGYLDEEEMRRFDPDLRMFTNLNTTREMSQAEKGMEPGGND